jgi:hypothetical protein
MAKCPMMLKREESSNMKKKGYYFKLVDKLEFWTEFGRGDGY